MYLYEASITKDDLGYTARIPDIGDVSVTSEDEALVIEKAAAVLKKTLQKSLLAGGQVPTATFGRKAGTDERIITLALDVSLDKTKWFTVDEAMTILNVTQPRISHLLRSGKLKAYREGRRTYILKDSLQAYLATPRRAGRPRKTPVAERTGNKK